MRLCDTTQNDKNAKVRTFPLALASSKLMVYGRVTHFFYCDFNNCMHNCFILILGSNNLIYSGRKKKQHTKNDSYLNLNI